jgi:Cu/Ag efflux protein CusF
MNETMKSMKSLVVLLAFCLTLPAFAQMRPAPAPVGEATMTEVTATIEDLDLETRMVTLKGPAGKKVTTEVSPKVKNLDQVKVGDEVTVQYYLAVMVSAKKVGDDRSRKEEVVKSGAAVAEAGDLPAGVAGREVRATVEILGTDPYKKAIAFRPADGKYREVSMDAPHLEGRLEEFKEGDMVEVVYREALAVFVEPK